MTTVTGFLEDEARPVSLEAVVGGGDVVGAGVDDSKSPLS
eukprot:CAMPEP_0183739272 /NCGR_PEP_ID=MMETSP0737-20130205/56646_1 /TAXON_ID=385413 /ORGANISM="Thalassiosira miniscula, Strain CCMP1093" /LENGTH=39 /DNA_ID= /DNA_START= /DNA_END= /DNA_ORIENTATION=